LWTFGYLFRSIWGCPIGHKMGDKTNLKPVFWLFQTIFPKRMGLEIWLGAYFQA
jgi:hypothetical protein